MVMDMDIDMDRWRSFFNVSGSDIWTVIHEAIKLAAMDYPKEFRTRRGEIAETIFARSLLHPNGTAKNHGNQDNIDDTDEEEDDDDDVVGRPLLISNEKQGHIHANNQDREYAVCGNVDDEAGEADETFSDNQENDDYGHQITDFSHIKQTIADSDQPETVVLEALQRLQCSNITVDELKSHELGRHVNNLRKHPSKRVRSIVRDLVRNWKVLVDAWVDNGKDGTAAVISVDAEGGKHHGSSYHEKGSRAIPHSDGAQLQSGTSAEFSSLFSFINGENYGQPHSIVQSSTKDNPNNSSRSHSGSLLTDSSDIDAKASTSHSWGLATPEERGSATRDVFPCNGTAKKESIKQQIANRGNVQKGLGNGVAATKVITNDPGRANNLPNVKVSSITAKSSPPLKALTVQKTAAAVIGNGEKASNMKVDKGQVDQKLEIAKRKLQERYQEAQNAKKQRTVQVLDLPNIPKSGQLGRSKVNQPFHMKFGGQNRR